MIFLQRNILCFFSLNKQIDFFCKESKKKQNLVLLTKNYQNQN